jgi:hypothetical protein
MMFYIGRKITNGMIVRERLPRQISYSPECQRARDIDRDEIQWLNFKSAVVIEIINGDEDVLEILKAPLFNGGLEIVRQLTPKHITMLRMGILPKFIKEAYCK